MKLMICFDIKASLDIAPAEQFPVNRTEELRSTDSLLACIVIGHARQ